MDPATQAMIRSRDEAIHHLRYQLRATQEQLQMAEAQLFEVSRGAFFPASFFAVLTEIDIARLPGASEAARDAKMLFSKEIPGGARPVYEVSTRPPRISTGRSGGGGGAISLASTSRPSRVVASVDGRTGSVIHVKFRAHVPSEGGDFGPTTLRSARGSGRGRGGGRGRGHGEGRGRGRG